MSAFDPKQTFGTFTSAAEIVKMLGIEPWWIMLRRDFITL